MRTKIVAGNWKMNKTLGEAKTLTGEILNSIHEVKGNVKTILCVPFPYLLETKAQVAGSNILIGAQNCNEHDSGAYTGEVSADMLRSMAIPYVIIGHSERRQYYNEDGKILARKVNQANRCSLTPIFCCGEPLEIREKGTHEELIRRQVEEGLFHLDSATIQKIVIAYEPVWAIGTGKTATSQQAQEMHAIIRKQLATKYGETVAQQISILYGGSVKPDNAKELFSCSDVDGGLVGGASLKAKDFIEIAKSV